MRDILMAGTIAALAAAPASAPDFQTFDGYAFGMTIAQAESVVPHRRTFECGRLMTSRCIVYKRQLAGFVGTVTIQFSLDGRRIDRIEIAPHFADQIASTSCDTMWKGVVSFLAATYGAAESSEGNTLRWQPGRAVAVTATVIQGDDGFCEVTAAFTATER